MGNIKDYTLFYNAEDGVMYKGTCREEKEVLVDIHIGERAEIRGYRGEGTNLILTELKFETTADIALVVPENTTIVLERGNSNLVVHAQGPDANVAAVYAKGNLKITGGEGTLLCDTTSTTAQNCLWSRCICARYGDLTVTGGNIIAYCGTCKVKAGALYAGGRLYGGENQAGAITIIGGKVTASAIPNTIRATKDMLMIGAHSVITNSDTFSGGEEEWHGDYLAQADLAQPLVISFEK